MKIFKNRVLAVLMTVCMVLSLLPISAWAVEEEADTASGDGYELSFDLKGTGVTWYARDEAGAELEDGNFAIPPTEIEVEEDGDVPTIKLTTTLYVKANRGYSLEELTDLVITGEGEESDEPSGTFDMQITDDAEYCDLKVTLIFDGYVIEGKSASITLTIDADPTYFTLMAGGAKLDISKFSTVSYTDAEAIIHAVDYNANGTTVPVIASVADSADGVVIGYPVVDGVPVYDEESHTGVNAFVDVTPENTIQNPVYVAVKYIPNKEGVTEAKPYDEYFKIALYMAPAAPDSSGSSTSVSPTNDKLEVDGKAQSPAAYKIDDYNYFKLRDIAALLNGTDKQFSVGYDPSTGTVTLTSGQSYEVTASDLAALPAESRQATASTNVIYINGASAQLIAYNIDGYNYFKLRDLASALDFYVGWTAERGMFLESDKPYSA